MNADKINLREIKEMRLNRHWSQEQLAEMSGLSIRTIQRIENGENAGLESLKALAAVFETDIVDSDKKAEMEQVRKEETYIEKIKGMYGLIALALFNLGLVMFNAIKDSSNWGSFFAYAFFWGVILVAYYYEAFGFFGEEWKKKMIDKKFRKK